MDFIEHTLTLSNGYGREVPPAVAGSVLNSIGPLVRSSILMAFEGRGSAAHRPPKWLAHASNIRFRRAAGRSNMVFYFAVPTLGEAASELYRQGELWPTRPAPEDTGFDVLCDVLQDVGAEKTDSDRFDDQLLRKVGTFGKVFKLGAERIALSGHRYSARRPVVVTSATIESAQRLTTSMPRPQAVRLVGTLDMIRVSTQRFAVKLDEGVEVPGVFLNGPMEELRFLLNQRVLITGRVVFRPSGRVLRVDAERVVEGADESSIWSQMPAPAQRGFVTRELHKRQGPRSGVAAIIGRWPGDESDEEIEGQLEAIS